MIVGIGCDIVDHETTRELDWSSARILKRIFSTKELELYETHKIESFLCGRFAAKEALLKSLGSGMKDGIALTDIQILQTDAGQPVIHIQGEVERTAKLLGIVSWYVSISHSNRSSIAFVVAET